MKAIEALDEFTDFSIEKILKINAETAILPIYSKDLQTILIKDGALVLGKKLKFDCETNQRYDENFGNEFSNDHFWN